MDKRDARGQTSNVIGIIHSAGCLGAWRALMTMRSCGTWMLFFGGRLLFNQDNKEKVRTRYHVRVPTVI